MKGALRVENLYEDPFLFKCILENMAPFGYQISCPLGIRGCVYESNSE